MANDDLMRLAAKWRTENGDYPEAKRDCAGDLERAIAQRAPLPDNASLVPGVMHCAKCKFRLHRTTLYVRSGTAGPGDSKTEPCPNGCGPLWPVTWEQEAREAIELATDMHEKLQASLHGAVPEGWDIEVYGKNVRVTRPDGVMSEWHSCPKNGSGMYDLCLALAAAPEHESAKPGPDMSKSWPERDYMCVCSQCGASFVGWKRQVVCKTCAAPEAERAEGKAVAPVLVDASVGRTVAEQFYGTRYGIDWVYHHDRRGLLSEREAFPAGQPEGVEALASQDEFDAALAEFYHVVCETVERGEPYDYDYTGREEAKAVCGLYAAALRRLASAQRAGKEGV